MFLSSIFIIIGATFLLKNLGYISQDAWGIIWPVALIVLGLWALIKGRHQLDFDF